MATHRRANVCVVNQTGLKVDWVRVIHKYSDSYRNEKEWKDIEDGSRTDSFTVDYNTGPLTTGRDWWAVSWRSGSLHCESDPHNLRSELDAIEKRLQKLDPTDALNKEPTQGFKAHILRAEDEGKLTRIILCAGDRIEIVSESGTSTTKYRAFEEVR
jgi:hypothetical protein